MKYRTLQFALIALMASAGQAQAQRGLPPKEVTRSVSVTKYAQIMEFKPEMVSLLKTPPGWQVSLAASGLGKPRMLYTSAAGNVYVTRRDGGDVLLLEDKNKDGKFENLVTVVAEFKGVHGITMKDNWMYLCNSNEVRRYPVKPDGTLNIYGKETLIKDLPDGGQHPNRTMDFGPDGMLYISVGSLCNDCKESDKETAVILQVDPNNWSRKIYASGLRNTIGFDWHPQTRELWGIDNGGDAKGNEWPPEEVNHITMGADYGFPYAYGKREIDKSREDPAGNTKEEVVKNTQPSVLELTAHMAPIGFTFFRGASNIPADWSGDGLVAWHGSWNADKPVGFKVQRIHFENGMAVKAEDFLTGFLQGDSRFGRPAGITVTKQGIIYISDDASGNIYAVKKTN
ncbi:glucose dehydrogenase [Pedobacter petrophilus]|uniref:Glucose dehydrogenase n=1 Tax=Pedobacter petrophilus TaxID=1908241 RepID=A0A7K0FVY8_9SPHI|nr:PQQ-dependent sugar dehydrogenase [Pedobacter petrophilus]MRX75767.1 glucose dehydrogenase [Pedobacter petrophilus]